jgi:hypothetical protein
MIVKMTNVIRNGSDEKAILVTDCQLMERRERGAVQESSSHLLVSGIESCPPGHFSDL